MIKKFIITESPVADYLGKIVIIETIISSINEIEHIGQYRTTMFNGRDVQLESQTGPHITLLGTLKRN